MATRNQRRTLQRPSLRSAVVVTCCLLVAADEAPDPVASGYSAVTYTASDVEATVYLKNDGTAGTFAYCMDHCRPDGASIVMPDTYSANSAVHAFLTTGDAPYLAAWVGAYSEPNDVYHTVSESNLPNDPNWPAWGLATDDYEYCDVDEDCLAYLDEFSQERAYWYETACDMTLLCVCEWDRPATEAYADLDDEVSGLNSHADPADPEDCDHWYGYIEPSYYYYDDDYHEKTWLTLFLIVVPIVSGCCLIASCVAVHCWCQKREARRVQRGVLSEMRLREERMVQMQHMQPATATAIVAAPVPSYAQKGLAGAM